MLVSFRCVFFRHKTGHIESWIKYEHKNQIKPLNYWPIFVKNEAFTGDTLEIISLIKNGLVVLEAMLNVFNIQIDLSRVGRFVGCNKKTLFVHGFYLRDASHSARRGVHVACVSARVPIGHAFNDQFDLMCVIGFLNDVAALVQTPAVDSFPFDVIDFQLRKISVFIKFIAQFKTDK